MRLCRSLLCLIAAVQPVPAEADGFGSQIAGTWLGSQSFIYDGKTNTTPFTNGVKKLGDRGFESFGPVPVDFNVFAETLLRHYDDGRVDGFATQAGQTVATIKGTWSVQQGTAVANLIVSSPWELFEPFTQRNSTTLTGPDSLQILSTNSLWVRTVASAVRLPPPPPPTGVPRPSPSPSASPAPAPSPDPSPSQPGNSPAPPAQPGGAAGDKIVFPKLAPRVYGSSPFTLPAYSLSRRPLVFTSSRQEVATVSGRSVTLVGTGTTTIEAKVSGIPDGPAVARDLIVRRQRQRLRLSVKPVQRRDVPFEIAVISNSDAPLQFSSEPPGAITVESANGRHMATASATGKLKLTATQPGDANRLAAKPVSKTLTVKQDPAP